MAPLNLLVFIGSVRDGRMASRVAKLVCNVLDKHTDTWEYDIMDPMKEPNLAVVRKPFHFYREGEKPPQWLVEMHEKVKKADAYITVCGEYNREIPPALTATMDQFPPASYASKPCLNVCYSMGNQGGAIAGNRLRSFLTELAMIPLRSCLTIPTVHTSVNEDGSTKEPKTPDYLATLLKQLEWYAVASKKHRQEHGPFPL